MNSGQSIAGSTIMPYGDGMPCTFNPADDVPAKEQITSLEDIQDLWGGGGSSTGVMKHGGFGHNFWIVPQKAL